MTINRNNTVRAVLLTMALLSTTAAVFAAHVGAQSPAAPVPDCSGLLFDDPEGDQRVNVLPLTAAPPTPVPANDNVDIRQGWINTVEAGGRTTTTANLQVTNLSTEREAGAFAVIYTFTWTDAEEAQKFVQAQVDDAGATFAYGTVDQTYTSEGTTSGKLYEGANGIVSIVIPRALAQTGRTLTDVSAAASNGYGDPNAAYFFPENDGAAGKSYRVAPCGGGDGSGTDPQNQASPFDATVSPASFRSKKVRKARSVKFTVDAGEELKNAKFTFKKGSRTLGTKSAPTFTKGAVTIKLKKRGLKKGSYSLTVAGTRANGAAASETVKIRVR